MNLDFGSAHLRTLNKLNAIAEKHNCLITFGTRNSYGVDLDDAILKLCKVDKRLINKLNNPYDHHISIKDCTTNESVVWFELYDLGKGKHNTMSYGEYTCGFEIEKDFDYDDENEKFLDRFIEESRVDWDEDNIQMRFHACPTIIHGFKYKSKHLDYRVYRPDMALKYFGDLVCEYLKEPYIKEVY